MARNFEYMFFNNNILNSSAFFFPAVSLKKRLYFIFLSLLFSVIFAGITTGVHAQIKEKKKEEIKQAETGFIVKTEEIENARIQVESIQADKDKTAIETEPILLDLESDVQKTIAKLDKLQKEKETYQTGEGNPIFLQLLDKELSVIKQKIEADNELIQIYKDRISALQRQSKVYADYAILLESIKKLPESIAATSVDQINFVKKELELAKSYITVLQANIKENETLLSLISKELEETKMSTPMKEQALAKELELLMTEIKEEKVTADAREKAKSIFIWQKAVNAQRTMCLQQKLKSAKIRYDESLQALKNAELNTVYLKEKTRRLEEALKVEELKKKQAELEAAKQAEKITQKAAEITREEAEIALQRATKKVEEVVQKQLLATSPEKKRVLELEAEVHKQEALLAKKKDELITEGVEHHKDTTDLKKLETDIEYFLSKDNSAKETDAMLLRIESELKKYSEAILTTESLIASLNQEKYLFSENITRASEVISNIEKEVEAFEDRILARQAIEYARKKVKILEEQHDLLTTRLVQLHERLEIKKNALLLLQNTRDRLIDIKVANIWTRKKSTISTDTFLFLYKDIADCFKKLDHWDDVILAQEKKLMVYLSDKIYTIHFWIRLFGVASILTVFYFSHRYVKRLCTHNIPVLYASEYKTYYLSRLLPSLLIILQKSIIAVWLTVLAISISIIFAVETPWAKTIIYVLSFFAIYKILKGFLIESFGPEKGDKKLVLSMAYVSPKHLYKSTNIILIFSLYLLSIIVTLTVFNYRKDVIELHWFVYRVGILILLLWIATQKNLIFNLLPSPETPLGRIIHRIIKLIYPFFIAFVVSLFAIRILGYQVLAFVLLKTCIKSFILLGAAFWVWKFFFNRLNRIREIYFTKTNIKKDTPEEKKFHAITGVYQALSKWAVSIITAIIIIRVWGRTFKAAMGSPEAPFLVQKIFGHFLTFFTAVGNTLRYRFVFEEGRYTTPLKVIFALTVLVVSFFFARYIKKTIEERVFHSLRLERGLSQTFSTLIRYIIIGIATLIGLNMAGIPIRSLAFFAGAFGIGLGFGMQNLISNFVSGIILLFERPMRVGDVITLEDGTLGTIDKISTRSTTLTTPDNIAITVPNAKFIESRITNWSLPNSMMRGNIKVGVAYGSDVNLVKECLLEIARKNTNVRPYPEPFVRFDEFGDSALNFKLFYWADDPGKRWFAMSEMHFAVEEVFRKNNITIAFPQRDIHIRSFTPDSNKKMQDLPSFFNIRKSARQTEKREG